jgi:hypothetical protein
MDYNMNEIDIPDFKKQKKGKGAIKDFIKKHKTKIEVASGLAALSLPFLTYLAMRDNKGKPLTENRPLTEAEVMALPKRDREIQEALARERVKGTSRENLPMYPPSGGPTQKQMDDAFLESMKKTYRDKGIERFKDDGKTYFSGYVKPSAQATAPAPVLESRQEEQKMSGYPSGFPPPRARREIPPRSDRSQTSLSHVPPPPKRHLGFFVVPPEIRSPRSDGSQTSLSRAQVPQAIPLRPEHKAFLETKKGRGFMDWIKKHKRELGITTAGLAGLAGLAASLAAAHTAGENQRGYRLGERTDPASVARSNEAVRLEVARRTAARQPARQQPARQQPTQQPTQEQKDYFENFMRDFAHEMSGEGMKHKGSGKPNKLAKQVMEYKKKHNVTLKEAWAHFK